MIYLDNAATTFPKPKSVITEMTRCMEEYAGNPGRGSHMISQMAEEAVFKARETASKLFNVKSAENVIFTKNATEALCLAIFGTIDKKCRVITTNLEHNSVMRPLHRLSRDIGIKIDILDATKSDDELIFEFEGKLKSDVGAVICTHASNICPRVLPIEKIGAICKKRGVPLIIDAAQSAGSYNIDIEKCNADIICMPGHKGLFGPTGTGMAIFCRDFDFSRLRPLICGGTGVDSAMLAQGHTAPESFEAGTLSVPAISGLYRGMEFVMQYGTVAIREHEEKLYKLAKARLCDMGATIYGDFSSGAILTFSIPGKNSSELAAELGERGICVRSGLHCAPTAHKALCTGGDAVRISFSPMNKPRHIDALTESIADICGKI